MDKSEIYTLRENLCRILGLPTGFNEWSRLYSIAGERLDNRVDCPAHIDAEDMIGLAGLADLSDDKELYVIHEVPESITILSWGELRKSWESVWSPPADDALLLYIDDKKLILITHWDVIYFS